MFVNVANVYCIYATTNIQGRDYVLWSFMRQSVRCNLSVRPSVNILFRVTQVDGF